MAALSSALRMLVGFLLFCALSLLTLLAALPLLPWRVARIRLCNLLGKTLGRSIVFLAGVTPNVPERARLDGAMPAIYVANHTSTLDLFLSIWLCPFGGCGVMKREIARVPVFGQLALLSGHLLLDRGNPQRAIEALREIAELMKAKRLGVWIMPEGTRSRDGRLLPFKKGFVHLAIATGFPVVPVVFHGAHKNWTKGTWTVRPMVLDVDVLEPIDTTGWREETAGAHAEEVHERFVEVLREEQRPLPAPPAG